ncbi:MAG: Fe-S cluster protein [Verrucomicrobiales bacterium]|nr:Fe-S cluster protein [Verrucomicrobiales bacterium]HCU88281.1 Fe-S cluster protein [Verrucomicrobiales bacterium]|tara:strand:- start:2300 stop:3157 length:858 start_codon:yes stop_codon:yes gene_type:complete
MAIADETTLRIVLYEGEGAASLEASDRSATVGALLDQGYAVTCAGSGAVAPADDSSLLVLGRFTNGKAPEAEDANGKVNVAFRDITGLEPDGITALVETERESTQSAKHGEWKPWFPVIDFDRCTNCMQCLSFCLFDVYGTDDDQQIQVQNNDNCKTNCPACSRVCPEAAIMFPKYKSGPINGDVVSDTDLNREKMKIDISALLGGDVYQMLRDRSQRNRSRFSKERDSDKALGERTKCLTKLAAEADIDIPLEVLQSLPSADEIAKKAAAANAKAQAAMDARDN